MSLWRTSVSTTTATTRDGHHHVDPAARVAARFGQQHQRHGVGDPDAQRRSRSRRDGRRRRCSTAPATCRGQLRRRRPASPTARRRSGSRREARAARASAGAGSARPSRAAPSARSRPGPARPRSWDPRAAGPRSRRRAPRLRTSRRRYRPSASVGAQFLKRRAHTGISAPTALCPSSGWVILATARGLSAADQRSWAGPGKGPAQVLRRRSDPVPEPAAVAPRASYVTPMRLASCMPTRSAAVWGCRVAERLSGRGPSGRPDPAP